MFEDTQTETEDAPESKEETDSEKAARLDAVRKEKLMKIVETGDVDAMMAVMDKISAFAKGIEKNHPDYADYRMYHVIGSSSLRGEPTKFDFPGDDSVEKFIEGL